MLDSLLCNIWWFLAGLLLGLLICLFCCCFRRRCCAEAAPISDRGDTHDKLSSGLNLEAANAAGIAAKSMHDLTIIEGIGPKTQRLLNEHGINNWSDLASTSVSRLREIVSTKEWALLRLPSTESWPEQAALARDGRWKELKSLKDKLIDGTRVEGE